MLNTICKEAENIRVSDEHKAILYYQFAAAQYGKDFKEFNIEWYQKFLDEMRGNKIQKKNGAKQMLMMLKTLISVKWFAKENKKISAHTLQAQNDFFDMNILFQKNHLYFYQH